MFTWWYYIEIILTKIKSLKCTEHISLLRSHSDLGVWITPHFCSNDNWIYILLVEETSINIILNVELFL